jgi:hypothetical protein
MLSKNKSQNLIEGDFVKYSNLPKLYGNSYNEEYFEQYQILYSFAMSIALTPEFNRLSTKDEKIKYIEDILVYSISNYAIRNGQDRSGDNCQAHYNVCVNAAEDALGVALGVCTGTAIIAGIVTGGPGAAVWPICAVGAGLQYDIAVGACADHLHICNGGG